MKAQEALGASFLAASSIAYFLAGVAEIDRPDHVFYDIVPLDADGNETEAIATLKSRRPLIVIWPDPANSLTIKNSASSSLDCSGVLNFYLEANTNQVETNEPAVDPKNESEVMAWWNKAVGDLLFDTVAAGHNELMAMLDLGPVQLWRNPLKHRPQMGDYHAAIGSMSWGVE